MESYQERVIEEKQELDDRIDKLESFLLSGRAGAVVEDEIQRMNRQCAAMKEYSDVLGERIDAFTAVLG